MKIFKYLIYLILLFGIGGAILISTDKGEYTTSGTKTIEAPREMVYTYFRNWENWKAWHKRWTEDSTTSLHSEDNTLEWASKNEMYEKGKAKLTKSIPYSVIAFNTKIATSSGEMEQQNKIELKKEGERNTKIEWNSKVKLSFWQKVKVRFGKGDKYIHSETDLFLSSLETLESILISKMNEHHSEVVGMTLLPAANYIHTASSNTKENFIALATQKINQLYSYTEQYGIPVKDVPEIIIHKLENNQQNLLFSVALALPAEYELKIENPELVIGTFEEQSALKTTLIGNYKYWEETLNQGIEYLEKQRLEYPLEEGIVIKWINFKQLPVNPAEWLTEIYIPAYEPQTLVIP